MQSIVSILLTFVFISLLYSCSKCSKEEVKSELKTIASKKADIEVLENEGKAKLKVDDTKIGTGTEAVDGKMVTVEYTGYLENGTKFDSTKDRKKPFDFVLGEGQVIKGWEVGIKGMKVGGVRKLTIPPSMGYGDREVGGVIPANSTLIFDVELLSVE